jgi:N-acetylglucosaminyldiphosphoundecaprenol N-acetyl-beta-D-mannosaminyltransferase
MRQTVYILGVPVDTYNFQEVIDFASEAVESHSRKWIASINPEIVMQAQQNRNLKDALSQANLRIPDGTGVVWAGRYLRLGIPERVAGVDVVEKLIEIASKKHWRIFLLGGMPGVANRASQLLKQKFTGLEPPGSLYIEAVPSNYDLAVYEINRYRPDILVVSFGAPKQEIFISQNLKRMDVGIAIAAGGTIDYLAGDVKRAPGWVRELGLEWLYRLFRQPWRWRRMLALPLFAMAVLREAKVIKRANGHRTGS